MEHFIFFPTFDNYLPKINPQVKLLQRYFYCIIFFFMVPLKFHFKLSNSNLFSLVGCFIFYVLLMPIKTYGQQTKFDSIYYHTAVNVTGTDSDRALHIADSLYLHTTDATNKIRALMLSANIYTKKGKINSAIDYALQANLLAEQANNYDWEARISGFLSTQYRLSGIKSSGLQFLSKGLDVSKKISNPNTSKMFQALAYQEQAYYRMEEKDYTAAIESLDQATALFAGLEDNNTKFFLMATNEELLGKNNYALAQLEAAKEHYLFGFAYLEKGSGDASPLKGFINNGLGMVFYKEKKYPEALEFFLKAVAIAEQSDFLNLKIEVYKNLTDYYDRLDDATRYKQYNKLYNEALQSQIDEKRLSADKIVTTIKTDAKKNSSIIKIYLYVLGGFSLLLLFGFYLYGLRKKREKEQFMRIVKNLRERSDHLALEKNTELAFMAKKSVERVKQSSAMMSPEVEQSLLKKLQKFELGTKFTDKNISLSSMSASLDTNSKYLSYMINHYKGKDFNSYINELRIHYIINKIENDAVYANYKISYLAEEAGFSSHSKFSAVFKAVLGLSPSVYLEQHNAIKNEATP